MRDLIAKLESVLDKLASASDQKFAKSLIKDFKGYGGLTPKQTPWVQKLIDKAEKPVVQQVIATVGDFLGVYQLFEKAAEVGKLKFPKINLQLPNGTPLVLYRAGSKSKVPGVINLTDGGGYGIGKWYGRVYADGKLEPSVALTSDDITYKAVSDVLGKLSKDPAGVAAEHGKLTGRCCFCNRPLSDEKSTAAGYGEICSKKYGLHAQWKAAVGVLSGKLSLAEAAPDLTTAKDTEPVLFPKELTTTGKPHVIHVPKNYKYDFKVKKAPVTVTIKCIHGVVGLCNICAAKTAGLPSNIGLTVEQVQYYVDHKNSCGHPASDKVCAKCLPANAALVEAINANANAYGTAKPLAQDPAEQTAKEAQAEEAAEAEHYQNPTVTALKGDPASGIVQAGLPGVEPAKPEPKAFVLPARPKPKILF